MSSRIEDLANYNIEQEREKLEKDKSKNEEGKRNYYKARGYKVTSTVTHPNGYTYQVWSKDGQKDVKIWVEGKGPTKESILAGKEDAESDESSSNSSGGYSDYWGKMFSNAQAEKSASYAAAKAAREEAERLAEIARQRGVVDSNTLYQQQKATYGANAEQLGSMGLTVSGYSDYLNSQAYAAGMSYRQSANAQAAEANREARYTEQLAKLEADKIYNDRIADIETAKYNQIQAEKQQQQAMYASLMEGVMNGTISADQVATYAQALGITDQSMIANAKNAATTYGENTLTDAAYKKLDDTYNNQIAAGDFVGAAQTAVERDHYTASDEEKQKIMANEIINNINNSDSILGNDQQILQLATNIGAEIYGEEGEGIKEAYSEKILEGTSTMLRADFEALIKSMNEGVNKTLLTEEAKKTLQADFDKRFKEKSEMKGVIDIYASDFSMDDFGKFNGSKKENSKQSIYSSELEKTIREKIADGTLEEGTLILVNYGHRANYKGYYEYQGDGEFKKLNLRGDLASLDEATRRRILLPPGYEWYRRDQGALSREWEIVKKEVT